MEDKLFNYQSRIQTSYRWIAIVGLVVLTVVVIISIRNYINFRDSLIHREQMQLLTIAESVATGITDFVDKKQEDVRILRRLITDQLVVEKGSDTAQEIIEPIIRNYIEVQKGEVLAVEWLDAAGNIVSRYSDTTTVEGRKWILPEMPLPGDLQTTHVGSVVKGDDGQLYIDILEPVYMEQNHVGSLRMILAVDHINEQYVRDIKAGEKGYASVKDSKGILLMHPKTEDIGTDLMVARKTEFPDYDWSELERLLELQKAGQPGVGIYHSIWYHDENRERVKKFNAFYPATIGADFWIVTVSMDYNELVDIVNKHLYTSMIMIGGIPILFLVISGYVMHLNRKLNKLQIEHTYVAQLNTLNRELEEDIKQRKTLEGELIQSKRRFQTLFNAGVDLTFVLKRVEGTQFLIKEVNDTACARLGFERTILEGKNFFSIDATLDEQALENIIGAMKEKEFVQFKTEFRTSGDRTVPVEVNGRVFKLQNQAYIMLIARDIEERIAQAEELERHRAMMIYKNRMVAMGEMVANIAHQWRQPLSSLNLMLSNLEDAYEHQTLEQNYLSNQMGKAKEIIQHMSAVIDEFRFFFNPKGEKVGFNVQKSIHQVLEMLQDKLRIESIQVKLNMPAENIDFYGYPNQLAQVLLNLIGNAADAFKAEAEDKCIEIKMVVDQNWVNIQVKDNAGGVEQELMKHLFEPYFTTKIDQGGTGIGLYMSRMIVETKFNGIIQVGPVPGGLAFTIELPLSTVEEY